MPDNTEAPGDQILEPRGTGSLEMASLVNRAFATVLRAIEDFEGQLGRLDAVAGDGDHGTGMTRGLRAATAAVDGDFANLSEALRAAGVAFGDRAGGTSGIIWSVLLDASAVQLKGRNNPSPQEVAAAVRSSLDAVTKFGHATLGDKTMVDALIPFSDVLSERVADGATFLEAWADASIAARNGADQTAALLPRIGRARPLAARSIGYPDPGAVSLAICVSAIGEAFGVPVDARLRWQMRLPLSVPGESDEPAK
jgi:dihydroxyacetone kinase